MENMSLERSYSTPRQISQRSSALLVLSGALGWAVSTALLRRLRQRGKKSAKPQSPPVPGRAADIRRSVDLLLRMHFGRDVAALGLPQVRAQHFDDHCTTGALAVFFVAYFRG